MQAKEAPALPTDAPIAGQSMTAPLGERPWQNPPQLSSVNEAIEFYIPRITEPKSGSRIMDMLEMGIPVATLVDTIQLGGVMEGIHSVDVGMLVSPVLAETIVQMAEKAEVPYQKMPTDVDEDKIDSSEIVLAKKLMEDTPEKSTVVEENTEELPVEELKGLMARRNTDGV